jgi:hypothetical protein
MKPKKEGKKLGREARERRSQKKPRKREERSPEKKALDRGGREEKTNFSTILFHPSLSPLDYKTCLNRPQLKTLGQRPFITYLTVLFSCLT